MSHQFYAEHLDKNLAVNVFKNGEWGTYRHIPLSNVPPVEKEHFVMSPQARGNLSSLSWIEGPNPRQAPAGTKLVDVSKIFVYKLNIFLVLWV